MSENVLTAVLTLSLLASGTAAIGTEMLTARQAAPAPATTLAQGAVSKASASSAPVIVLPKVVVTFSRVAMASSPSEAPRVE